MALPSTTYDIATATNPSSALTDFTFIVDLSTMSAAWWAAVDTSDGTKGRASKSDGTTELACDWIDFDSTAETGILRVKYTGTLASTGTQQIRVYPPVAANSAYGVSDTYGQYNAYDSNWLHYWPMQEDPSGTAPQFKDRINSGYDLSSNGLTTSNVVSGNIGKSLHIVGSSSQTIKSPNTSYPLTEFNSDFTSFIYMKFEDDGSLGSIFGSRNGGRFIVQTQLNGGNLYLQTGAGNTAYSSVTLPIDYSMISLRRNGTSFTMGSDSTYQTETASFPTLTNNDYQIGLQGTYDYLDAFIYGHSHHSSVRSDSFLLEERAQSIDNTTFWGTWTNVPVGGDPSLTADPGSFTLTGQTASVIADRTLSASGGTFTLTGQDVTFIYVPVVNRTLSAEGTTFVLVGNNVSLLWSGAPLGRGNLVNKFVILFGGNNGSNR